LNARKINPYSYAFAWTKRLIGLIQPKVVFGVGKTVHSLLEKCYGVDFSWHDSFGRGELPGGVQVLSYSRTYSTIRQKEEVAKAIDTLVLV